jgi:hypothetical protein
LRLTIPHRRLGILPPRFAFDPPACRDPAEDTDFDGLVFSSTISAASQSVGFYPPVSDLLRHADYDLTGQQLINCGLVLISGERVGIEPQSAEADIR